MEKGIGISEHTIEGFDLGSNFGVYRDGVSRGNDQAADTDVTANQIRNGISVEENCESELHVKQKESQHRPRLPSPIRIPERLKLEKRAQRMVPSLSCQRPVSPQDSQGRQCGFNVSAPRALNYVGGNDRLKKSDIFITNTKIAQKNAEKTYPNSKDQSKATQKDNQVVASATNSQSMSKKSPVHTKKSQEYVGPATKIPKDKSVVAAALSLLLPDSNINQNKATQTEESEDQWICCSCGAKKGGMASFSDHEMNTPLLQAKDTLLSGGLMVELEQLSKQLQLIKIPEGLYDNSLKELLTQLDKTKHNLQRTAGNLQEVQKSMNQLQNSPCH